MRFVPPTYRKAQRLRGAQPLRVRCNKSDLWFTDFANGRFLDSENADARKYVSLSSKLWGSHAPLVVKMGPQEHFGAMNVFGLCIAAMWPYPGFCEAHDLQLNSSS
jgi:hypothetical protein